MPSVSSWHISQDDTDTDFTEFTDSVKSLNLYAVGDFSGPNQKPSLARYRIFINTTFLHSTHYENYKSNTQTYRASQ